MYDLSRFGRIFMMDFTAGSSLVFETGMCRKRWWYLVEYGTEHLILCAGVMVCAWTDLKYGKVRNYWLWLLTAAGVLHRGSAFFFGAVLFLAAGMCLFRFRVMGAGDGKLMAVIGGYLGPLPGFYAIALGFLTGAVWSLWRMKRYGVAAERFNYMKRYVEMVTASRNIQPYDSLDQPQAVHHIPFAVCLAAGVLGYLFLAWCGFGVTVQ